MWSYVSIPHTHYYTAGVCREDNNRPVCACVGRPTPVAALVPGHGSLCLIMKRSHVAARANIQSHFLLSFLSLCVWFPSLSLSAHRKQGSAASPTPASPGTKAEKKCIPSCLRHKRCIKRAGWPTSPGRVQAHSFNPPADFHSPPQWPRLPGSCSSSDGHVDSDCCPWDGCHLTVWLRMILEDGDLRSVRRGWLFPKRHFPLESGVSFEMFFNKTTFSLCLHLLFCDPHHFLNAGLTSLFPLI